MRDTNWLDHLIGWLSPKWGAQREAWRQTMEEQRHYDAGDPSRLNANWRASNQNAEYIDRYSRDTVRARARDLERNSDMMNAVIGAFVRNTVGGGITLQADTGSQNLNGEIETLWKRWCKKQNCDVTGTQSLCQMLRMAVRRKKVDGGILFVKRYTHDGILPFQLQLFEVDELDGTQFVPRHQGNRVVGGIEYTPYNRPVGYWLRQYPVDGFMETDPVYIEAKDAIFYFSKRRPSQLREMSDMSQTITRIRDINEFMVAVAVKQRIEACLAIFIKRVVPFAKGIGDGGIGRALGGGPLRMGKSYEGKTVSPGMIGELNDGDEIEVVNPQGQATDAASYISLQQHLISSGQGLSYESVARDMKESTYSSARQGMIEDGMTYAEETELLHEVLDEIYETFLISAVLAGKIRAADFWENKQKYFAHHWVKPPKPWIDPLKEASAVKVALQTGQKTWKQLAAENGSDWQTQIDDIADVLEYAREQHGIDLGGVIFGKTEGLYGAAKQPDDGGGDPDAGTVGK